MYIKYNPNPCGRNVGDCADFQELLNEAPNDRIRQKMMEVMNEM